MYRKIHEDLLEKNQSQRKLNIGSAVRQYMRNKRISMKDLLKKTKINESTIKNILHYGEMNTSQKNFTKLVKALGVSVDEFILTARETSESNLYILKNNSAPIFKYDGYEVESHSPSQFSQKDFILSLIRINPRASINHIKSEVGMEPVCCFIVNGHLNVNYNGKTQHVHTNQSFIFDPNHKHSFRNPASSGTTDFYILFRLNPKSEEKEQEAKPTLDEFSVSDLIQQIRKELSPHTNKALPTPSLAALSGIDANALNHLQFRENKVIPFDKLELLASTTENTFEQIIQKSLNTYKGFFHIYTDENKFKIDLSLRYGTQFTSHTQLGTSNKSFTIADITLDPYRIGFPKKQWQFKAPGFMAIKVERGIVGLQYGKQPLKKLEWGDSVYLNTDVGFTLENLIPIEKAKELEESAEPKAMLFSSPPLF